MLSRKITSALLVCQYTSDRHIANPISMVFCFFLCLCLARCAFRGRFLALPDYPIEQVQVFARPVGVAARSLARWQSTDGVVHRVAGSLHFQVQGARIAQIAGAF